MKNLTLENIAVSCHGKLYLIDGDDAEKEVSSVIIDSRKCEKDCLFVATKGERVDGHSFVMDVWNKGALCVIVETIPENVVGNYILVEDSFTALKDIAEFYREQLSVKIVGVVGSVGKTSTKEIVSSVLSEKYNVQKTQGNFNNEVGVPLTLFTIDESHEVAVVEMGISDFGEMRRLSKMVKPNAVIMTNIGPCHLENLIDLDGVLKAKSEVFEFMDKKGVVILNGDDEKLSTIRRINDKTPIYYGLSEKNDIYAKDIVNLGLEGTKCTIYAKSSKFDVHVKIPGEHMVINALAGTAIGLFMSMEIDEIKAGIEKAKGITGRSNVIVKDDIIVVDDCYNANPKSMKAAIDLLSTSGTTNIAVLGDMFELGENEEKLHAEIGEYISSKKIDVLVCVGKLAENIYDKASNSDLKKYYFNDLDECQARINDIIANYRSEKKPAVLLKASHGMHFEKILEIL